MSEDLPVEILVIIRDKLEKINLYPVSGPVVHTLFIIIVNMKERTSYIRMFGTTWDRTVEENWFESRTVLMLVMVCPVFT